MSRVKVFEQNLGIYDLFQVSILLEACQPFFLLFQPLHILRRCLPYPKARYGLEEDSLFGNFHGQSVPFLDSTLLSNFERNSGLPTLCYFYDVFHNFPRKDIAILPKYKNNRITLKVGTKMKSRQVQIQPSFEMKLIVFIGVNFVFLQPVP